MDKLNQIKKNDTFIKRLKMLRNLVVFLTVVFLIVIVASSYALASRIKADKENKIPSAELSQSIFEQQNNDAAAPAGKYNEYYLYDNHYSYDVVDAKQALKGSTYFYSFNDDENSDCVVGVSEIRDTDLQTAANNVISDLNDGFSIGKFEFKDNQHGYKNGWETDCLFMTSGNENAVSYFAKVEEGMFVITAFGEIDFKELIDSCMDVFNTVKVSDEWIMEHESTTESAEPETEPETDIDGDNVEHLE